MDGFVIKVFALLHSRFEEVGAVTFYCTYESGGGQRAPGAGREGRGKRGRHGQAAAGRPPWLTASSSKSCASKRWA